MRLIIADMAVLTIAFLLAYVVRQNLTSLALFYLDEGPLTGVILLSLLTWLLVGVASGFYRNPALPDLASIFNAVLRQAVLTGAVLSGALYLAKFGDISRSFMLMAVALTFSLVIVMRVVILTLDVGDSLHRHYVIVGTGKEALDVAGHVEADKSQRGRVLAFLGEECPLPLDILGRPVLPVGRFRDLLRTHVVDEVIVALDNERIPRSEQLLLACQEEGVKFRLLVSSFGSVTTSVSLDQLFNLPLLTFSTAPDNDYLLFLKRIFDIIVGSSMALLFLVPSLFVMLAIKLSSSGPIFFIQERCGLNGRRFQVYKFRSMCKDAPLQRAAVAGLNQLDGPTFKCQNDPRITPVGRYLRRFSIDEWPQLINVIKGDMSIVGPRPPLPEEVEQYKSWQRRRLRMRPGLTCLWVINGHNRLDFLNWMRLDLQYIDRWSLALDFKILLRSIPHVLSGKGM